MKQLLLIAAITTLCACKENSGNTDGKLSADLVNNPASAEGVDAKTLSELPTMDFTDTMHNFGNMKEGEVVTYDFEFKNNGKKPLIISSANGSCGCTAPDYPHDPIKPGETGIIKVKFNSAGKPNHQEKSVTISTNSARGTHMLYIKADVEAGEKDPNVITTTLDTKNR
ncbi:hypothetical protein CAP35_08950 [Chitinophagaceae bacterium IBVUCB1]|nr:hypothetical protein CAP35_08950 [Chitinophagaceae bacterium IBVUCB1]